ITPRRYASSCSQTSSWRTRSGPSRCSTSTSESTHSAASAMSPVNLGISTVFSVIGPFLNSRRGAELYAANRRVGKEAGSELSVRFRQERMPGMGFPIFGLAHGVIGVVLTDINDAPGEFSQSLVVFVGHHRAQRLVAVGSERAQRFAGDAPAPVSVGSLD